VCVTDQLDQGFITVCLEEGVAMRYSSRDSSYETTSPIPKRWRSKTENGQSYNDVEVYPNLNTLTEYVHSSEDLEVRQPLKK
jgi:hypothetical protein